MLTRRYQVYIPTGDGEYPFTIQNAPVCRGSSENDIDWPVEEEVSAPGLKIRMIPGRRETLREARQRFRAALDSNFVGEPLPACIADALCGLESEWKVIRVTPQPDTTFFVLVNPDVIIADDDSNDWSMGDSIEAQLKHGCFWAFLSNEFLDAFEVSVVNDDGKVAGRYVISRPWSTRFDFGEYNENGLFRQSQVKEAEKGLSRMDVTEYL